MFQTFHTEDVYVEDRGDVEYLNDDHSIYDIIESMEMPHEWVPELHDYCTERNIYFMSTLFDKQSAELLSEYVPAWKIASHTSSHHPFLREFATTDKPILMSTGTHELAEMVTAIRDTEAALGTETKAVLDIESELYDRTRRAVHAVDNITSGEGLTTEKVNLFRSGERDLGSHPKFYDEIIGKPAARDRKRVYHT
jgi:sialic acid synthase SpsE